MERRLQKKGKKKASQSESRTSEREEKEEEHQRDAKREKMFWGRTDGGRQSNKRAREGGREGQIGLREEEGNWQRKVKNKRV